MMILDEPSEGRSTVDRPTYLRRDEIVPELGTTIVEQNLDPILGDRRAVLHHGKGTIARSLTVENVNEHHVRAQLLAAVNEQVLFTRAGSFEVE